MRVKSSPEIFSMYRRVDYIERLDGKSFSNKTSFVLGELNDLQKRIQSVQKSSLFPNLDLDSLNRRVVDQYGRLAHEVYDTKPTTKVSPDDAEMALDCIYLAQKVFQGDTEAAKKILNQLGPNAIQFCYYVQGQLGFERTSLIAGGRACVTPLIFASFLKTGKLAEPISLKMISEKEIREILKGGINSEQSEKDSPKVLLINPRTP